MATLDTLIVDTLNMLYGQTQAESPETDTLAAAVSTTSDTTWEFVTTDMWKRGDFAEHVDSGSGIYELVQLGEDHPSGTDVTVRRAQRGTTASTYASGAVFNRNPTFPKHEVAKLVSQVVDNELWPDVWYRTNRTLTGGWVEGDTTYDLAATDVEVEKLYQYNLAGDNGYHELPMGWWDVEGSVDDATVTTTGRLLRIFKVYDPDASLFYTVRAKPSSDDVSSLPTQIANMVPWGACGKLIAGTRTGPQRVAPSRSPQAVAQSGDRLIRDYAFFDNEFRNLRTQYKRELRKEAVKALNFRRRGPRRG